MCDHKKEFDEIKREIQEVRKIAEHQNPSAKTLIMFDQLTDKVQKMWDDDVKEHAVFNRVLFGDDRTGDLGIQKMVQDMHTAFMKGDGVIGFLKLMALSGGVISMLYVLFKKIP